MRVLLFVEREGRVVCVGRDQKALRYAAGCPQATLDAVYRPFNAPWFLVECPNADAGRWTIHWHLTKPTAQIGDLFGEGA